MRVALIGATGLVGREMLAELEELNLEFELNLFASKNSAGKTINFKGKEHLVSEFNIDSWQPHDFVLMSAGSDFSREYSERLVETHGVVIDNSSAWRMTDGVPLIVPEINSAALAKFTKGIVANPNCSTIQMVICLKPFFEAVGIETIFAATYQSVSGAGQNGISALEGGGRGIFAERIVNNVIPAIDVLDEQGWCKEERKMREETSKIFDFQDWDIAVHTARVPVTYCHSEAITLRLKRPVSTEEAENLVADSPGLVFCRESDYEKFPYPSRARGDRRVFMGRLRAEPESRLVHFWCVADNLRKGAATNAVQIMECLAKEK